ncbi:MAG: PEP-CTERM sorting domain-containing protein [Deltaproteobacteria bacterium]|nr:MAG: PEP-CTERM sorting domain-containing protein [Deltaproteobacteria bacterium]
MRIFVSVCALLSVLGLSGMVCATPSQWSVNGHWYEAISGEYTWVEAKAEAEARTLYGVSGHLVTLTTIEETDWVWNFQSGLDKYWLGGYRVDDNGTQGYFEDDTWAWVTGEEWDWTNWAPGRPNDYYGGNPPEDSLNFHNNGNGTWNDAPSNDDHDLGNVFGYIVEYEQPIPNPEPGTILLFGSGLVGLAGARRRFRR